jgi:hypothetical protein
MVRLREPISTILLAAIIVVNGEVHIKLAQKTPNSGQKIE